MVIDWFLGGLEVVGLVGVGFPVPVVGVPSSCCGTVLVEFSFGSWLTESLGPEDTEIIKRIIMMTAPMPK